MREQLKKKQPKVNWDKIMDALWNKPKGAKGHAAIKRDKKQALAKAKQGK